VEIGVSLRLMGDSATADIIAECTQRAEASGLDAVWVPDHIAIPPDDAEGSNGRYLDALASLAWLAAKTSRIALGLGVLVLPYRRPLPTAKSLATIQELSNGRLRIGAGIGWMDPEFRALGIERYHRGRDSDATLDLLQRCFGAEDDVVVEHGQPFLFRPRPRRPPILIGGAGSHALERAARFGDGWMPMLSDPSRLAEPVAELRERFEAAGKPVPQVVCFASLPRGDLQKGLDQVAALQEVGVTGIIQGLRYATAAEFAAGIEPAAQVRNELPDK
jgi:probable F420-dependent oxidoreductase